MFRYSLILVLALCLTPAAFAGSTNAEFDCVSASSRTKVRASVPGDHAEHEVTFTIDGASLTWFDTIQQTPPYNSIQNSLVSVLGEIKAQNYHFVITSLEKPETVFTFSAIPGSARIQRTANGERGRLQATVQGVDPRNGEPSKVITVSCNYVYEI